MSSLLTVGHQAWGRVYGNIISASLTHFDVAVFSFADVKELLN